MLATIAGVLTPVFRPLGADWDWRLITSLICGFMAKESVVTITVMLYAGTGLAGAVQPLTAASMLVFCLLHTPCVAAIAAIRREMGRKWAWFTVLWQCSIAWLAAAAVRLIGMLFGAG